MTPEEKPSSADEAAEIYANCRNGKQAGANYAEWSYSYQGHVEGVRWKAAQVAEAVKLLHWVRMNSGIAVDGNHADPIAAHRENGEKLDAALALLRSGARNG